MDQNCFTSTTLCLRKNATVPLFLYSSLKKWTNFHNLWYAQSWKYLTLIIRHLSTIPENVTMLPCEMRNLTRLKLYDFLPKFDNYKIAGYYVVQNFSFRQPMSKELQKVTIVCVDIPFLSFWDWSVTMPCYHSAHVSTKSWCQPVWILCMLCCFTASSAYTTPFCEFIREPQLFFIGKKNKSHFWL